jgi:hypothetical protein
MENLNGGDPQQSNQTIFDDICRMQNLIKYEFNLAQHCKHYGSLIGLSSRCKGEV